MFLKNRAVQIKMVNTKDSANSDSESINVTPVDPEAIAKIATDFTVRAIGAVGIVIAGNKVLSTFCDIAVIAAKAKLK